MIPLGSPLPAAMAFVCDTLHPIVHDLILVPPDVDCGALIFLSLRFLNGLLVQNTCQYQSGALCDPSFEGCCTCVRCWWMAAKMTTIIFPPLTSSCPFIWSALADQVATSRPSHWVPVTIHFADLRSMSATLPSTALVMSARVQTTLVQLQECVETVASHHCVGKREILYCPFTEQTIGSLTLTYGRPRAPLRQAIAASATTRHAWQLAISVRTRFEHHISLNPWSDHGLLAATCHA